MAEKKRALMRAVWPLDAQLSPLEVGGVVTCWPATLRGRSVLIYDKAAYPRTYVLPDQFHLHELLRVDLSSPEDVAEFCSTFGFPGARVTSDWFLLVWRPPFMEGNLDVFVPTPTQSCETSDKDDDEDEQAGADSMLEHAVHMYLREAAEHPLERPPVVLTPDDGAVYQGMVSRQTYWGIAVDLLAVTTRLAQMKDMVRLCQYTAGARTAKELQTLLEAEHHPWLKHMLTDPGSVEAEIARALPWWPELYNVIGRARREYQWLYDPIRSEPDLPVDAYHALRALASFINRSIASHGYFIEAYTTRYGDVSHPPKFSLDAAVGALLYRDLTTPGLHYTRCANETCPTLFTKRRDSSNETSKMNSGWSTGVKYCSPECARMQAQREYRRRVSRARSLAHQGVSMEEIAQQLDRDVATVKKWLG